MGESAKPPSSTDTFSDPQAVARYAQGPPRLVPGFADLQRMALLLLAERAPDDARVLVLGAGGGLEMKLFAEAKPGWRFDGVDPSAEMLNVASATLGPLVDRATLHHGLIDVAPEGPFDAATCILTLHFIERDERVRTLREVHRRLKPEAPFAVAHFSFPQAPEGRDRWLARYAAFAVSSGVAPEQIANARTKIGESLPILSPEDDEQMLREAGFGGVELFYAGFAFRGWVAYA
jgi:tRNA (cmo5U34)-methyltransferase